MEATREKRTFKQSLLIFTFKGLGILLLGLLFLIFTSDEEKYGGTDCVILHKWASIYSQLSIICGSIILIFVVGSFLSCSQKMIEQLGEIIYLGYLIFGTIVWILMIYALTQNEACASLRTIVIICILICIAFYVLECVLFCCCQNGQFSQQQS